MEDDLEMHLLGVRANNLADDDVIRLLDLVHSLKNVLVQFKLRHSDFCYVISEKVENMSRKFIQF